MRWLQIFYQPDDGGAGDGAAPAPDGAAAAPDATPASGGDGAPSAAGATGAAAGGAQGTPYHTYGERTFRDANELNEHLRRGTLDANDYREKMSRYSASQRTLETDRTKLQQERDAYSAENAEMIRIRDAINSRSDLREVISAHLNQPLTPQQVAANGTAQQGDLETRIMSRVEELMQPVQKFVDRSSSEQANDRMFAKVAADQATFPDGSFPTDHVREEMARLSGMEQDQILQELAVLIGRNHLGQQTAASAAGAAQGAQGRVAASHSNGTKRPPGGGSPPTEDEELEFASMAEAREAARAASN